MFDNTPRNVYFGAEHISSPAHDGEGSSLFEPVPGTLSYMSQQRFDYPRCRSQSVFKRKCSYSDDRFDCESFGSWQGYVNKNSRDDQSGCESVSPEITLLSGLEKPEIIGKLPLSITRANTGMSRIMSGASSVDEDTPLLGSILDRPVEETAYTYKVNHEQNAIPYKRLNERDSTDEDRSSHSSSTSGYVSKRSEGSGEEDVSSRHSDFSSKSGSKSGASEYKFKPTSEAVNSLEAFYEKQGIDGVAYKKQRMEDWVNASNPQKADGYDVHQNEDERDVAEKKELSVLAAQLMEQNNTVEELIAQIKLLVAEVEQKNDVIKQLQGQLKAEPEVVRPVVRGSDQQPQVITKKAELPGSDSYATGMNASYGAPYVMQSQPYSYVYPLYTPVMPVYYMAPFSVAPMSVAFGGFGYSCGFGSLPMVYAF